MRGLRYISLHEISGYGHAARGYLRGLRQAGVPLTWTPLVWSFWPARGYAPRNRVDDDELADLCDRCVDYDTVLVHAVPELIPRFRERGKRLVGYTTWETDRLPPHWPALLNQVDLLLVPSAWNRATFAASGVRVPMAVVPHLPEPNPVDPVRPPQADFIFYTIGEWNERKVPWLALQAFLDEFKDDEPVTLVIKTGPRDQRRPGLFGGVERRVRAMLRGRRAQVVLITRRLATRELYDLHARGDCFLSLCRGEGWGLPAFDAAFAGKPVIMTGWGGQTEYLPGALAWLVDYRLVPVNDPAGRPSYLPDQRWAEPSLPHARALMRYVYEHSHEARMRGARLADHVRGSFSHDATMQKLLDALAG
jgi:glycosyltransferase involved in cell wall biosynthesis